MDIFIKNARKGAAAEDGYRILVDRLWPRGVSRETLRLDGWIKDVAPSTELRKWFNHEHEKWEEFKRRYFQELDDSPDVIAGLMEKIHQGSVTLVFGSHESHFNNAVALKEYLEAKDTQ